MRFLRNLIISLLFLSFSSSLACGRLDTDLQDDTDLGEFYWAESEGARNALQRMSAMAQVKWQTMNDITLNGGTVLTSFKTIKGIPYSSTKEINKYVGIDVSFYSFLTAAKNPFSVLYTENIGKPPYNGVNCACYYGTVCSASVSYALGFKIAQPSFFFPDLDGMERVDNSDISLLKACDILQSYDEDGDPGHVLMIYKIEKDRSGEITGIIIFEAASSFAILREASVRELSKRIKKDNMVAYRYKYLDKVPAYDFSEKVVVKEDKTFLLNTFLSLCPNRGDCSVYRYGEDVEIDVLDGSYSSLVLQSSGHKYEFKVQVGANHLSDLLPGHYKGYLTSGGKKSEEIEFVIANPKVNVSVNDTVHIDYDCDFGTPSYCVVCKEDGGVKYIYDLTEDDIARGYVDLQKIKGGKWYYKVVFYTVFGTVINQPICA